MRQRKAKNLVERIGAFAYEKQITPEECRGKWQELFAQRQPLFLELGCGKGQFIISMAERHPENNYIAVEGQCTVVLRALEKAHGIEPKIAEDEDYDPADDTHKNIADEVYKGRENLLFVNAFMRGLERYFENGELDGIFLNFSDPWPKARHAKRRLTHARFLNSYKRILKPGSQIQFKSDNNSLFDFSVNEFRENGFEITEISTDLHNDPKHYESADVPTEYEQKFMSKGKNINYCKSILI